MYSREQVDAQLDAIVADMWKFMDDNPDFDPSDSVSLQRCGRYPLCKNYCLNKDYKRYGLCSAKCDSLADIEIDRTQQND
jgi:hypothetical protein